MNANRYIAALLICCFSAFLGHNLVPHHHHSEVYHSPIATHCPFEHGDHQGHDHDADAESNTDKPPTHCHAFNDVVFKKHSAPVIRPWTGISQAMMVPGQTRLPEQEQDLSTYTSAVIKLPCKTADYLGSRGLRAPPVFA
jgi:hypothetical protein